MPAGHGLRSRTRDTFSRGFRQKGYINLTTYLRAFRLGDYVDIKVNGAVHKVGGLPHRVALPPMDMSTGPETEPGCGSRPGAARRWQQRDSSRQGGGAAARQTCSVANSSAKLLSASYSTAKQHSQTAQPAIQQG